MGLEVQLQDEVGGRIDSVADPKNRLGDLLPLAEKGNSYPMLAGIDPYGDTVFNPLQIPRFLSEWADVVSKAQTEEDQKLVAENREFGSSMCQRSPHLFKVHRRLTLQTAFSVDRSAYDRCVACRLLPGTIKSTMAAIASNTPDAKVPCVSIANPSQS